MINSRTVPICFFVFYMLFTSCNNKNYIYLYEKDHSLTDTLKYKPVKTNYIVQPNDILHIDFYSALSNVESYFSFSSGSSTELLQAS